MGCVIDIEQDIRWGGGGLGHKLCIFLMRKGYEGHTSDDMYRTDCFKCIVQDNLFV